MSVRDDWWIPEWMRSSRRFVVVSPWARAGLVDGDVHVHPGCPAGALEARREILRDEGWSEAEIAGLPLPVLYYAPWENRW